MYHHGMVTTRSTLASYKKIFDHFHIFYAFVDNTIDGLFLLITHLCIQQMLGEKGGGEEDKAWRLQLSLVVVKTYLAVLWKSASCKQNPVGVGWRNAGNQSIQQILENNVFSHQWQLKSVIWLLLLLMKER